MEEEPWDELTEYPPLPKAAFLRALASHGVTCEQAKRQPQGVMEFQRGMGVTWLEIHENDEVIPPMSVRGLCEKLGLDRDLIYAETQRLDLPPEEWTPGEGAGMLPGWKCPWLVRDGSTVRSSSVKRSG